MSEAGLASSVAAHTELAEQIQERLQKAYGASVSDLQAGNTLPLLMQVEDFLSSEEATALVAVAEATGFQRGHQYIDGAAELRTSATTFCRGPCEWAPEVASFVERVSGVLGLPASHFEPVQFVRYAPGEHYAEHSDFVHEDVEKPYGPRLLTFFVYLTGGTFRGGETSFDDLGVKVKPIPGRAVVWTNTSPFQGGVSGRTRWLGDSRTQHAALAVEQPLPGEAQAWKYAINVWVHNGDIRHRALYQPRCASLAEQISSEL